MPTVRAYGSSPKVQAQPLPNARLTAVPSPESFGAGALDQVTNVVTRWGSQIAQDARDKQDQAVVLEADNQLATWEQQRLYDPAKGVLNTTKGKDAFALPDAIPTEFNDLAGNLEAGLSNDRQRLAFARLKANRLANVQSSINRHVDQQMSEYATAQSQASLQLAQSAAVNNAGDPHRVGEELNKGVAVIADQLRGQSPEAVAQETEKFRTAVHTGVIDRLLATGQDRAAQIYFDEVTGNQRGYGTRADGTPKGDGFLGPLKRPDGKVSSELSMGTTDVTGKETEIPLLVPTLTKDEVTYLLSAPPDDWKNPTMQGIAEKAVDFARERQAQGKPFFAGPGEQRTDLFPELPRERVQSSQISGDAATQIQAKLQSASTEGLGLRTASELWTQFGPKTDDDPIALDKMEDAARERFADDPKALKATTSFLRERKIAVDASRQDRFEQISGTLFKAASQGASLTQIRRLPEYLNAPGRVQSQISDYIANRDEHAANRALAAESRAYTAESRAYTREQRAKATEKDAQDARFYALSNPAVLSTMSEDAVQATRGEIGDERANQLLERRKTLTNPGAIRAATIDADQFSVIAGQAGITDKAELVQLRDVVEAEIAKRDQSKTAMTREQKGALMKSVTDQHVMLNVWGFDQRKIAAMVTNPDDRKKAYVPYNEIPAGVVEEYKNYATSEGFKVTTDAVQRAYALRLLGATRADVIAALKGQP